MAGGAGGIVGAALGVLTAGYDIRQNNKRAVQLYKSKLHALSLSYNFGVVALNNKARDTFDQARRELEINSLNALRNESLVTSALYESGTEGRSQNRVVRDVRGHDEMIQTAIKENELREQLGFMRDAQASYINFKEQTDAARSEATSAQVKGFGALLKIANAGAAGYQQGAALSQSIQSASQGTTTPTSYGISGGSQSTTQYNFSRF